MKIETIDLDDLQVNPRNDRHGELADEASAIEWLLVNRSSHMRNLAKDIVSQGRLFEMPLVKEQGGKFVVYDGNRRVTCSNRSVEKILSGFTRGNDQPNSNPASLPS